MADADRADWLARVEGMTRSERLMALQSEMEKTNPHRWFGWQGSTKYQGNPFAYSGHHANRALDLIAALERAAAVEAQIELARLRAEAQP